MPELAVLRLEDRHIAMTKAMLWEEAKGKMRAMVAVEGQVPSYGPEFEARRERWRAAEKQIEQFIRSFEGEGLHE